MESVTMTMTSINNAVNKSEFLLYLPLVSGDNNFICRSSARHMPWQ
jgi:hypothetical protein